MRRRSSAAPLYDTAPALSVVACTLGVVTLTLLVAGSLGAPSPARWHYTPGYSRCWP